MAALLIRIASLALPAKLRKKYLRAWLAELQDAKADGEGWAFAYDLLVNMGSLKEAAQGKDICRVDYLYAILPYDKLARHFLKIQFYPNHFVQ